MKSIRSLYRALKESARDEGGSASVELIVFAIPLFVPLILLASQVTVVSASKVEMAHLARTSLRAFATAENTTLGHARIRQVLDLAINTEDIGNPTASENKSTSNSDGYLTEDAGRVPNQYSQQYSQQ